MTNFTWDYTLFSCCSTGVSFEDQPQSNFFYNPGVTGVFHLAEPTRSTKGPGEDGHPPTVMSLVWSSVKHLCDSDLGKELKSALQIKCN